MWCEVSFFFFFFFIVCGVKQLNKKKNKKTVLFVTQFVFYLMVLFVHAANKGKATHGN